VETPCPNLLRLREQGHLGPGHAVSRTPHDDRPTTTTDDTTTCCYWPTSGPSSLAEANDGVPAEGRIRLIGGVGRLPPEVSGW
jgi:hypothetical protein